MGLDQEVTNPELTEKADEYDVAEEVFEDVALDDEEETTPIETEELAPVSQADQGQAEENSEATSKQARAIWMKAFKTYVGRQFLIFPKWRVGVDPGTVDLTVNTADLNVTINGVSYATTDGNN